MKFFLDKDEVSFLNLLSVFRFIHFSTFIFHTYARTHIYRYIYIYIYI